MNSAWRSGTVTLAPKRVPRVSARLKAAASSPCTMKVCSGTPPSDSNHSRSSVRSACAEKPSIVSIRAFTGYHSPKIRTGVVPDWMTRPSDPLAW